MKNDYIPILVEVYGKKELWRLDITNLSVTQLIELKEEIISQAPYNKTIQILDSLIKKNIEKTIPTHNLSCDSYIRTYKKNKKEEKQKRKIKNIRRKYDKYKR